MNPFQIRLFIGSLVVLIIIIAFSIHMDKEIENTENNNQNKNEMYWGVDSATNVDDNQLNCVKENFGEPEIWGRYLGDKKNVSTGLSLDEIEFLHEQGIQILTIYNHFTEATGYDQGVKEANQAISYAEDLDIPKKVAIFGDVEPNYPIDSGFIEGWYQTLAESDFTPGLYGVFDEGSKILEAYNSTNEEIQKNMIVWTSYPQQEITTKEEAPQFNPTGPIQSMLYGWQYGIDAKKCVIDTNLFKEEILDYVW